MPDSVFSSVAPGGMFSGSPAFSSGTGNEISDWVTDARYTTGMLTVSQASNKIIRMAGRQILKRYAGTAERILKNLAKITDNKALSKTTGW